MHDGTTKKWKNRKKRELDVRLCSLVRNGFLLEAVLLLSPILNSNWNQIHYRRDSSPRITIAIPSPVVGDRSWTKAQRFSMANDGRNSKFHQESAAISYRFRNWDLRTFTSNRTLFFNIQTARGKFPRLACSLHFLFSPEFYDVTKLQETEAFVIHVTVNCYFHSWLINRDKLCRLRWKSRINNDARRSSARGQWIRQKLNPEYRYNFY